MSKITEPMLLDSTGKEIVEKLHTQNMLLNLMAGAAMEGTTSMAEIRKIVQAGKASEVYNIGDQIVVPWTDVATGQKYEAVGDIVHFGNVTLKDGEEVPGMFIQWHYATPFGVQFDNNEAFYTASEAELPAGTYNITVGANWGNNCKTGEKYQFVLTKPVPQGGMLVGFWGMPDKTPAEWRVSSYRDGASTEAIETVSVTTGSAGTSLGTFTPAGDGSLNSLHRLSYGYNRWSQSAMRQWLNSDKPAGQWWTSQNKFDRVPEQHATKAGFMSGFEKEFLDCIQPIKVVTALNTVSDKADGETEVTYDTFFLPSLEQMYITPQLAGEGDVWEYWKRASGMSTKMQQWQTYPQIRTYAIESHTSAQGVRLRSAYRDYACYTWLVYSSGGVGGNSAVARFAAPRFVLSANRGIMYHPLHPRMQGIDQKEKENMVWQ